MYRLRILESSCLDLLLRVQDYNAKLFDFGLAKNGPIGDKYHVSTRIIATKSLDKSRPPREQNLVDWAFRLLKEKKKLLDIDDPRLGDCPVKGFQKASMLAYHCLNCNPKARPLMRDIVDSLEPLQILPEVLSEGTRTTLTLVADK
ncbi:hypothetical protein L6452_21882 [Arctium lappa]|uniref:Uncharacterized protein n=1 Tax=Arctium lappa TaxID=4217 RepID=A0ACB9AY98_ARCLA|nr:hypothetical protein L6452_21882 [Arctium lappa]